MANAPAGGIGPTSSATSRSRLRLRSVTRTALATGLARGVGLLASLLGLPLALSVLGAERFGVFATVTALTAILSLSDLGIASGLVTPISTAIAEGRGGDVQRDISSAFAALTGIGALLFGLLVALDSAIPWGTVVNASTTPTADISAAMAVFGACVLLALPFQIVPKVQLAAQRGATAASWQTLGALAGLLGVVLAWRSHAGLSLFVGAQVGGPAAATVLSALTEWTRWPEFRPLRSQITPNGVRSVLTNGGHLFIINIAAVIALQADAVIVAQLFGAGAVGTYVAPQRLFLIAPYLFGLALTPLWPAYSEALAVGDSEWVWRTYRRTLWVSGIFTVIPSALLVFAGTSLISAWTNGAIIPPSALLLAFAVWAGILGMSGPTAMVMNGLAQFRFLALASVLLVPVNLVLVIVLGHAWGLAGVPAGAAIAQLVVAQLPSLIYIRRHPEIFREGVAGIPGDRPRPPEDVPI